MSKRMKFSLFVCCSDRPGYHGRCGRHEPQEDNPGAGGKESQCHLRWLRLWVFKITWMYCLVSEWVIVIEVAVLSTIAWREITLTVRLQLDSHLRAQWTILQYSCDYTMKHHLVTRNLGLELAHWSRGLLVTGNREPPVWFPILNC